MIKDFLVKGQLLSKTGHLSKPNLFHFEDFSVINLSRFFINELHDLHEFIDCTIDSIL